MRDISTRRTGALLLFALVLLASVALLTVRSAQAQLTPGVDFGAPIVDVELALAGDGTDATLDVAVIEDNFYAIDFVDAAPDNPLTLTGSARLKIQNSAGVDQTNGINADSPIHKWRATFTGTITLVIDGAQDNVDGTFQIIVYELQDDHADDRTQGTLIEVGELVDGSLVASSEGVRDLDWFGFQGRAGVEYNVILTAAQPNNPLTMPRGTVTVFQGSGLTAVDAGNQDRAASFIAAGDADYYIEIRGPQPNVEGTYQLRVEQVGGSPVRVTPNPGGYAAGVVGVVVEVLGDGASSPEIVADAIADDSNRSVIRLWMFTTNNGWLLWAPGPINFGLAQFVGISSIFAVLG